jgi:hypothetical protein
MSVSINRTLRLLSQQHFPTVCTKSGICIHHTVCGSAKSTFDWWCTEKDAVGVAYIIDKDGTIYEVFNPDMWAWQFGLKWERERKIAFEKRFIGIEIASEGGLIERDGKLYCFDRISDKTQKKREEALDYVQTYRGYRYFDKYEPAQIDSLCALINQLCDQFTIPRVTPDQHFKFYGEKVSNFNGIIGHTMVREDKSDPAPDRSMWNTLIEKCSLQKINPEQITITPAITSNFNLEKLFQNNIQQINILNVAAGSMVKGLIMELERGERNTHINLKNAQLDGHSVNYDFLTGDPGLVYRIANAFGFKSVTSDSLVVNNG